MIDTVISIIKEAGAIALEHRKRYEVQTKPDESIVTTADLAVDNFIIKRLQEQFHEDQIMTEETEDTIQDYSGRVWVVDPIDGTKGFVSDGDWSVIIGLLEDGEPTLGVIYDVENGKIYHARKGEGAHVTEGEETRPLSVSDQDDFSRSILAIQETRTKARPLDPALLELETEAKVPFYSSGLQLCALAEGSVDVLLKTTTDAHKWDTCAGQAILEEAGGRITLPDGSPLDYTKKSSRWTEYFIASNGRLHAEALERFSSLAPSES